MKHLLTITAFSIWLIGCGVSPPPGARGCYDQVCIRIRAGDTPRINQPLLITGIISADKDYSHVAVAFYGDVPRLSIEGPNGWEKDTQVEWIDIKANEPANVSRRVLIPEEGQFIVSVGATATPGFLVFDSIYIIVTKDRGKVYLPGETVPTALPLPFPPLPTSNAPLPIAPPPTFSPTQPALATPTRRPYP